MWSWSAVAALAQVPPAGPSSDQLVTTVGAQSAWAPSVEAADLDLMFGGRLRWGLGALGDGPVLALADGRFTVDPAGTDDLWEQNRVRSLEARWTTGAWTLDVGRSAVWQGGPRLVDGLQARAAVGELELGGWAGLVPDLYTTRPTDRFGLGPIVTWGRRTLALSAVGELAFTPDGLDRLAALLQAGISAAPTVEVGGRLDVQLAGDDPRPSLADGAVDLRWRATDALRLHALYDAFSTLRYLQSGALDPDVQRFLDRLESAGLADPTLADPLDPRVYHLVGADGRWRPDTAGALGPQVKADARWRWHPDPALRYARGGPTAGIVAERLELAADLQLISAPPPGETAPSLREDLGLTLLVEPTSDGRFAVDTSARLLFDAASWDGPGVYADLFVDWSGPTGWVLVAGGSVLDEPIPITDPGFAAFVQLQYRLEGRRDPRSAGPSAP